MATGVTIAGLQYVGAPVLSAVFGFFKTSSGVQIQRLQITAQTPPAGGNISVQLVDESGNAYAGATVTLPSGASYYDQPLAAPITLGIGRVIRAQITGVDNGTASDITLNIIGATAQGATPPSGCGPSNCQPPQAQLLFFAGSVQNEVAAAEASAAAAASSATSAASSSGSALAAKTSAEAAQSGAQTAQTNAAAQVGLAAGYAVNANNAAAASSVYAGQSQAAATAAQAAQAAAEAAAAAGVKGARTQINAAATKTIADATPTAVIWDGIQFDDLSFWAAGSPTRITIPTGVTRVRLNAGVRWTASGTGERKLKIRSQNGPYGANAVWAADDRPSDATGDSTVTTGAIDVVAGMYFEAVVEQNSGGPLDLETTAAENFANFLSVEVLKQS